MTKSLNGQQSLHFMFSLVLSLVVSKCSTYEEIKEFQGIISVSNLNRYETRCFNFSNPQTGIIVTDWGQNTVNLHAEESIHGPYDEKSNVGALYSKIADITLEITSNQPNGHFNFRYFSFKSKGVKILSTQNVETVFIGKQYTDSVTSDPSQEVEYFNGFPYDMEYTIYVSTNSENSFSIISQTGTKTYGKLQDITVNTAASETVALYYHPQPSNKNFATFDMSSKQKAKYSFRQVINDEEFLEIINQKVKTPIYITIGIICGGICAGLITIAVTVFLIRYCMRKTCKKPGNMVDLEAPLNTYPGTIEVEKQEECEWKEEFRDASTKVTKTEEP